MKNKKTTITLLIGILLIITSCSTSMSPIKVHKTLPSLTSSEYLSQAEAEHLIENNQARYLVKGRKYTAPVGLTTKNDLRNGAKGIDEWVKLDQGNAYVLVNYQWITIDQYGSTQLQITFDTIYMNLQTE